MITMRHPIFRGLVANFVAFASFFSSLPLVQAASTPIQEFCIYANFSPGGGGGTSSYNSNSYNSNPPNWRNSGGQPQAPAPPPPAPPRPPPSWQAPAPRPTQRPYAQYPSYYLRNGGSNYYPSGQYPPAQAPAPSQSSQYHNRFIRETLADFGIDDVVLPENFSDDEADRPVSRNIISGDPIEQKSWPFLIALLTTGDTIKIDDEYWDLVCGGTLIHPQFVLTAAHCFVDEGIYTWKFMQASDFRVRIGDYNLLVSHDVPSAVDARVVRYTAHPRYDHKVVENGYDIALIQLDRPVQYNDWIKPACLPQPLNGSSSTSLPPPNVPCQVAGWGAVNNAGRLSPIPRFTTLPSSRQSLCYNSLQVPVAARDGRLFCAGDLTGKKDSCSGDSGGPIFCLRDNNAWELSGIVSFGGERCAQQSIPGAYTTISYYINWISSTMQNMIAQSNPAPPPPPQYPLMQVNNQQQQSPYNTRRPPLPPSRFSSWQPSLPGMANNNNNVPMPMARNPPSPPPLPPGAHNQTKTPEALLSLLQLLLNSFGGGDAADNSNHRTDYHHTTTALAERMYPLEIDLP